MNQLSPLTALLAGILSFLSPCVLPLIPGYLSFISGGSAEAKIGEKSRALIFFRTLFFVSGFTAIFTVLGLLFSGGGMLLAGNLAKVFSIVAGGIIVFFGLNTLFDFLKFLNLEARVHVSRKPASALGSFVVGMAFGAGWTPCIGPILGSILLLASRETTLTKAVVLLLAYSTGLALPFLFTGLFLEKMTPLLAWFKRRGREIRIVSGILLVVLGVSMIAGKLTALNSLFTRIGYSLKNVVLQDPGLLHAWTLAIAGVIALGILIWILVRHTRKIPVFRLVLALIFLIAFIFEATGLISLGSLLADWFLFQG